MVPAGNKAKRLSSVNHTTKTIHHHHHKTFSIRENKIQIKNYFDRKRKASSKSSKEEVANYLNIFFSNVVKNPEIPEYLVKESFHQNTECPTLKAVLKYRKHPSIISISHSFHQASSFNFSCIDKKAVLKEILRLRATKTSEDTDIPIKFLKENGH